MELHVSVGRALAGAAIVLTLVACGAAAVGTPGNTDGTALQPHFITPPPASNPFGSGGDLGLGGTPGICTTSAGLCPPTFRLGGGAPPPPPPTATPRPTPSPTPTAPAKPTATATPTSKPDCTAKPGPGINWSACDLRKLVLYGVDLTGANLAGANLTGANLSAVNLTRANLTGAILKAVIWGKTICPDGSHSNTNGTSPESCVGHLGF